MYNTHRTEGPYMWNGWTEVFELLPFNAKRHNVDQHTT